MVQINNSTTVISYREIEVIVPANKQYTLYSPYNTIQLLESNAVNTDDLSFRFGSSSEETPFSLGLNPTFPEVLPSLTITNKTNADITIRLALIVGDIKDNRLNVSGTVTTTVDPLVNVTASVQTFDASGKINVDSTGYKRVIIQNSSSTDSVYMFTAGAFELMPTAVFDMEISAVFDIFGTTGQSVSIAYFN